MIAAMWTVDAHMLTTTIANSTFILVCKLRWKWQEKGKVSDFVTNHIGSPNERLVHTPDLVDYVIEGMRPLLKVRRKSVLSGILYPVLRAIAVFAERGSVIFDSIPEGSCQGCSSDLIRGWIRILVRQEYSTTTASWREWQTYLSFEYVDVKKPATEAKRIVFNTVLSGNHVAFIHLL